MAFEIRLGKARDAGLLAEFGRQTFIHAFAGQIEHGNLTAFADNRFGARQQADELARAGTTFFIACCDGQIAGYAKLSESTLPPCVTDAQAIELERLYLDAMWQGRGIAKALLYACLAEARDRTRNGIWLDVWDQNIRAQEFYRRHTFHFVGERPYVVGNETQRHLLMYRGLANKDSLGQ